MPAATLPVVRVTGGRAGLEKQIGRRHRQTRMIAIKATVARQVPDGIDEHGSLVHLARQAGAANRDR
jgi:hypothetical protein